MFPFNPPGLEPTPPEGGTNAASPSEEKKNSPPKDTAPTTRATMKIASAKRRKVRTDVNDKAKFIETPTGKFRREFSRDHPLGNVMDHLNS